MKLLHQIDPQFEQAAGRDWNEAKSAVGKKITEESAGIPPSRTGLAGRATEVRLDELMRIFEN